MIKRVNYIYICLLMFSNLFSQEVFFEKDQTGLNLGYLYSSAGKSLDKTDESITNSIVGSYVFKGSFFFYGRVSDYSEEVNFYWKETYREFLDLLSKCHLGIVSSSYDLTRKLGYVTKI